MGGTPLAAGLVLHAARRTRQRRRLPAGAVRSVRANTPLVFLGNLGDPASEHGPH